ncbi:DUF4349 domain-containing protein [Actinomycetes bacterium KLBMP 9797]
MRISWIGGVVIVAAVALSGCGGGGADSGASSGSAAQDEAAAVAPQQGGQPAAGVPVKYRQEGRAIIYTGSMAVRVTDVPQAATKATTIVTGAGGFVGGDKRSDDDYADQATLTLRVPAARFAGVVDELARLGEPERRDISTEDVTEEALDLDARIATQRARVDSGRRLLAQAKSLSDLVMLEGEVAKREADLASLEAKKRRIDDLTALSTITLELRAPAPEQDDEEVPLGFLSGFKGGWTALVAALVVGVTVLGALLPWLVTLGVPALGAVWLTRRLRRRTRPAA